MTGIPPEGDFGGQDSWADEELWSYEIGSKTTFHRGRSVLNTALFHMDIGDPAAGFGIVDLDQERGALVGYLTNQPRTLGVNWRMRF